MEVRPNSVKRFTVVIKSTALYICGLDSVGNFYHSLEDVFLVECNPSMNKL